MRAYPWLLCAVVLSWLALALVQQAAATWAAYVATYWIGSGIVRCLVYLAVATALAEGALLAGRRGLQSLYR